VEKIAAVGGESTFKGGAFAQPPLLDFCIL
jgi:hypothetical protein